MAAIATNRVVAEFYQSIGFPPDWAEHPTDSIGVGLARTRVFSVVVLLDASDQPLAACWQADGGNEQFVRIRFDDGVEDDLLDGLDDAMATKSERVTGHADLFATMLWEPGSLKPDQGIDVHPPHHGSFFDPIADELCWNVDTRELVARASDLLPVSRQNTTGLAPGAGQREGNASGHRRWQRLHVRRASGNQGTRPGISHKPRIDIPPLACRRATRYTARSLTRRTPNFPAGSSPLQS